MMQGDSAAAISGLLQSNPQFATFMDQNKGRTLEEAFKHYGYDLSEVLDTIGNS